MTLKQVLAVASVAMMSLLVACGGGAGPGSTSGAGSGSGGGGTVTPAATTGAAMVALTDAPGAYVTYLVNVVSLQLKKADGTSVETLPATTQVDFAQLVNLSEFITAKQVPAGTYVSASLTLDYNGASIVIDNGGSGVVVPAANIINGATGNPLLSPSSQVTLTLQLPTTKPLVVSASSVEHLALDFNLVASNKVAPATITTTTPASSVTVTVNPVLAASIAPDANKGLRLRGPLVSVTNTATDTSYTVQLRPFFNADGNHGTAVVKTTSTTTYTINGTSYTGTAGLTALAGLAANTLTSADGAFDATTKVFTATAVLAGNTITGSSLDSVEGTVIARSGNVLTVSRGLVGEHDKTGVVFSKQTAVTVASTTAVTQEGKTGAANIAAISVGQHIHAYGTLSTDTAGNRSLDASKGNARLDITSLWGQYVSSATGVVTLNLQTLDGQPASVFNFAGTGTSTAQDAKATAYQVTVPAALAGGTPKAGAAIRFMGYVAPFGSAPPNFTAVSLASYEATTAKLNIQWERPGVTAPFVAPLSATNVVLSAATLLSASEREIEIGPQEVSLSTLVNGITLVPNTAATSTGYVIAHRSTGKSDSYSSYTEAITALNTALNGKTALLQAQAEGLFDATTGKLQVNRLSVVLSD